MLATGSIRARRPTALGPVVPGRITEIFVEEMDRLLECEDALRCVSSTPATWISTTAAVAA